MTTKARILGGIVLLFWINVVTADEVASIEDAVVKIYTTTAPADYFTPWSLLNARQGSGSGSIIDGQKILTNAHVVADATYIQVQKHRGSKRYLANVVFVSHAADLALLEVSDPDFFTGIKPLPIGELPAPLQEVAVFGYPSGGTTLGVTRGVLSRVEHQRYAHSGGYFLSGQIDAAINPGNSGGPVVSQGQLVGVVMQANVASRAENQGYFVPPSIVRHVLKDAADDQQGGFIELGFRTQDLDSPAARARYRAPDDGTGVLVAQVFEGFPAAGHLQQGDIIVAIDQQPVAEDSTVEVLHGQRTNYKFLLDQFHPGDRVTLDIIRDGKPHSLELLAQAGKREIPVVTPQAFDEEPQYLVYGGVVFVPLNMNLIQRWGNQWQRQAPIDFLYSRSLNTDDERQQLVVALRVLAADVNLGYHDWKNWIIQRVNNRPVRNFAEFCRWMTEAPREYTVFSDERGYQMVIRHDAAQESESELLARYRIEHASRCVAPSGEK